MDLIAQTIEVGDMLATGLAFLVIGGVITSVLLFHWAWQRSVQRNLERVARHLGGRYVAGGLLGCYGEISFQHQGRTATVRFSRHGKNKHFTHVELRWSGPSFRCEVYPERFLSGLGKLMGMQDIQVGESRFDREFLITGDNVPAIKSFINAPVQSAIFNLSRYVSGMHVRCAPSSLTVTCRGMLVDFVRLVEFVKLCCQLCDAAVIAQAHGIEFLEKTQLAKGVTSTEAKCMVCGETLLSEIVYCRACKTPHHHDCWSYGGGCSTYGCGERKFAGKG